MSCYVTLCYVMLCYAMYYRRATQYIGMPLLLLLLSLLLLLLLLLRICYSQLIFRRSSRIIVLLNIVLLNTTTNYFSLENAYLKINQLSFAAFSIYSQSLEYELITRDHRINQLA